MLYFLIFTSDMSELTKYILNITLGMLRNNITRYKLSDYKIFIIHSGNEDHTLKTFRGCEIYYTLNKEKFKNKPDVDIQIHDMLKSIEYLKIEDNDFIVKIDYNCVPNSGSMYIGLLSELTKNDSLYDCIISYGVIGNTILKKTGYCIKNVYAMRCKYLKQLNDGYVKSSMSYMVHRDWASVSYSIPDDKVIFLKNLDFNIYSLYGDGKYTYV